MFVGDPSEIRVISKQAKMVGQMVKKIVHKYAESDGVEPYDRISNVGFWRILLWRECKRTKEALISIVVSDIEKVDTGVSGEIVQRIKGDFKEEFKFDQEIDGVFKVKSVSIIYSSDMNGGY